MSGSDKKLIAVGGNKPGEIAVMSDLDWTLIATDNSTTYTNISIPTELKEILIITESNDFNTVHLPKIDGARGTSARFFGVDTMQSGAMWRVYNTYINKSFVGAEANKTKNAVYKIYGR